jgi:uncharacterized protein YgfB (UPF0149 family)
MLLSVNFNDESLVLKRGENIMAEESKKSAPKGLIAIIVAAVVVIGGGAAAMMMLNIGEKERYFLAERDTIDFIAETVQDRYEPEMNWQEHMEENVTESTIELAAEYNDPYGESGTMGMDPSQIINNSSLTITSATDMENEELSAELLANIGGIEIDGIEFYLTSERVMLGLPFLEEILQLMDEDFGPLLHEFDPATFTGEETLGLDSLFDGTGGFLSEEDLEYFQEEYLEMIFDELPESAFTSEDEAAQIMNESLDTEKITLHLTEDELKELINLVVAKMQEDDRLKELMREQFNPMFATDPMMEQEVDRMIEEFESGLEDAEEAIDELYIPDGLTSTLWLYDDLVAKRDFEISIGTSDNDLVTFNVAGEQLLDDLNQSFDYDLSFSDALDEGTMNISGDLSSEDNQIEDMVTLTFPNVVQLSYNGIETLADGTRDFERTFSFDDEFSNGSLIWAGSATYDNDQMTSEHEISLDGSDIDPSMFGFFMTIDSQTIDSVEIPASDNAKDVGSMNADELMNYFEMEVTPQFQQWLMGIMAGGGSVGF